MVADKVQIDSLSYQENAKAVRWECDGSPEYTMSASKKEERGTEITLHFSEDSLEFNDEYRILEMLKKFCRFLPYPIQFGFEKISELEGEKDKDGNQIQS